MKLSTIEQMEKDLKELKEQEKLKKKISKSVGFKSKKLNKVIEKVVGKYNPSQKVYNNLKYKGNNIIGLMVKENKYNGSKYSIDKIQAISNKLSKELKDNGINGKIITSMMYGKAGWKSGYFSKLGDDKVKLYDPNDLYDDDIYDIPDNIPAFSMYIALQGEDAGGNDKFNDCLFKALKYYIFNLEDYYKSPADLKIKLKLDRNDKIPLRCIDEIEKTINKKEPFQINILGDYIRTSTIKTNKKANITLINEHYEPIKIKVIDLKYTDKRKAEEKEIILYDTKTFQSVCSDKSWIMTKEEHNKIKYGSESKYIIINRKPLYKDENGNKINLTIDEEYKMLIDIANKLKEESKGLINMFKSGSYYNTCLSLFEFINKHIQAEPILQDEAEFIKLSSFGAHIWCEKDYQGHLYKYDVKSLYPSIYKNAQLKFPIKRGEFSIIDEVSEFVEFGIYRAVVLPSADENTNKLFKFSKNNYYTCVDLQVAKSLNLQINLIKDEKPNFLKYTRDKLITFYELFIKYFELLYPLKDKNIKEGKFLLNLLWGALCAIDKKKYFVKEEFNINDDEEIYQIIPTNDNDENIKIITTKRNGFYKTNYARLAPFIISNGRKIMTNFMKPHIHNIKRVLTDSIETIEKIHDNKIANLGQLKYEGENQNAFIKNCVYKIDYN